MKHKLPLFLATLCLGASAQAAVLDIGSITGGGITGTFPTTPYSDSNGIQITYSLGSPFPSSESSGYSGDEISSGNFRGMNGLTGFPDGHLAVGPGDTVTLDFSALSPSTVEITFIDLDGVGSNNENVTISTGGIVVGQDSGASGVIPNDQAHLEANLSRITVTPTSNTVVLRAAGNPVSGGNDTGYFAFTVATDGDAGPVIPEPSSSLLALLGLALVTFRRRR